MASKRLFSVFLSRQTKCNFIEFQLIISLYQFNGPYWKRSAWKPFRNDWICGKLVLLPCKIVNVQIVCVCVPVALHTVPIVAPFISESIILQPRKRMPYAIILGLVFSVSAAPGTVSLRQLQFFRIFVVFHFVVKQTRNVYITNDLLHIRIGLIGLLEACCDAYILPSLPCLWQWRCSWKGNFQSRDHSPRFES